jgi:hypothetical protein
MLATELHTAYVRPCIASVVSPKSLYGSRRPGTHLAAFSSVDIAMHAPERRQPQRNLGDTTLVLRDRTPEAFQRDRLRLGANWRLMTAGLAQIRRRIRRSCCGLGAGAAGDAGAIRQRRRLSRRACRRAYWQYLPRPGGWLVVSRCGPSSRARVLDQPPGPDHTGAGWDADLR